jgi:hypothetical protein
MTREKRLLSTEDTNRRPVACYKELKATWALEQIAQFGDLRALIPTEWFIPEARISRAYCYLVLASMQPEFLETILNNSHVQRMPDFGGDPGEEGLQICPEVA